MDIDRVYEEYTSKHTEIVVPSKETVYNIHNCLQREDILFVTLENMDKLMLYNMYTASLQKCRLLRIIMNGILAELQLQMFRDRHLIETEQYDDYMIVSIYTNWYEWACILTDFFTDINFIWLKLRYDHIFIDHKCIVGNVVSNHIVSLK